MNLQPKPFRFSTVEYERGGFFEGATAYTITINKDRTAFLDVFKENKIGSYVKEPGRYKTKIGKSELNNFTKLAAYADVFNLKDHYDVEETHPPYGILKIKNNKDSIRINDRGLNGTFSLGALHNHFDKLYNDLNWKKVNNAISR